MSKKRETDAEFEARMAIERQVLDTQQNCDHWGCRPSEWYWSGKVREMTCEDCGLVEFREEG